MRDSVESKTRGGKDINRSFNVTVRDWIKEAIDWNSSWDEGRGF